MLAARKGITLKVIPMNDKGELLLDEYEISFLRENQNWYIK